MNVINGFLLTAFFAVAMGLSEWVDARDVRIQLGDGDTYSVECVSGALSQPKHNGRTFSLTCSRSGGGNGGGKPPATCNAADPIVTQRKTLTAGQTIYSLSNTTTVLRFNSRIADKSVNISWGPYSSGGPKAMAVSISECEGDFEVGQLPRTCWSGAPNGNLGMTTRRGTKTQCKLRPNTDYVVNLSAIYVASGRPSCPQGGQCKIAFFASIQQ